MTKFFMTIAIMSIPLSGCAEYTKYAVITEYGTVHTNVKPEGFETVTACARGPLPRVDIINDQIDHVEEISDDEAQVICDDTIE